MTEPTERALRLASYNIRAGLGTDLKRDPVRVLHQIRTLGADIVTLQEADFRLGTRPAALPRGIIAERTGLHPLPIAENAESLGWHGIAMLAHPSILVQDIRRFDLPGLEPRGAVAVDVTAPPGPLRIVGVHLGLLRSSRRAQQDFIINALENLAPLPTIIMGDFNEWSLNKGLGRLSRKYAVLSPGRTYPARLPFLPLDRIAHCPELSVRMLPQSANAHPHASDHLPLLAEVKPNRGEYWRSQKDSNPQPAD